MYHCKATILSKTMQMLGIQVYLACSVWKKFKLLLGGCIIRYPYKTSKSAFLGKVVSLLKEPRTHLCIDKCKIHVSTLFMKRNNLCSVNFMLVHWIFLNIIWLVYRYSILDLWKYKAADCIWCLNPHILHTTVSFFIHLYFCKVHL